MRGWKKHLQNNNDPTRHMPKGRLEAMPQIKKKGGSVSAEELTGDLWRKKRGESFKEAEKGSKGRSV